jgi:hypothetical protein
MNTEKIKKIRNSNLLTTFEKQALNSFIYFNDNYFSKVDLNDKDIYWPEAWKFKQEKLGHINDLFDLAYKLFIIQQTEFPDQKNIFVKNKYRLPHQFIDYLFDWGRIEDFYGVKYSEEFNSFHEYLKHNFDYEPEKFLNLMKKINKILKKEKFAKSNKIKLKMKKI